LHKTQLLLINGIDRSLWSQNRFIETKFQFGDYVLWFLKVVSHILPNCRGNGLDPIGYNIIYVIICLLVTIDKFDPNQMFVNINKLKPCRFIEDKTLQLVLVKPNDMVINEPIQTKKTYTTTNRT
jgi:hypothetical protein